MPSNLRHQIEPSITPVSPVLRVSSTSPPRKTQQAKSTTHMLKLAHTALDRFTREADRKGHDLRLLVGHADLLNALLMELEGSEPRDEQDLEQGDEELRQRGRES